MIIKGFRYGRRSTMTLTPNGLEIKTEGTLLGSGKETELVRYVDIIGVEKSKDLLSGRKLTINTANDKKLVDMLEKDKYESFASSLNQKISNAKESAGSESDSENPYDKIRKAKELLDIGAITEEEFQKIKNKYIKMI